MKKTLAAVAVLGAFAGSAIAADVTLYGRIDTGVGYSHVDADMAGVEDVDSFEMKSGQQSGSRWGLKGTEDLGNGLTVGFILEDGFTSDDGAEKGVMFDRESSLFLEGGFGKLAFGRIGSINNGTSSWAQIGMINAFGTSSWGGHSLQVGSVMATAGMWDNMVAYQTPNFAGFTVYAQYAMGNKLEDTDEEYYGDENESSSDRYYAIGATYENGPIAAYFAVDSTNYATWNGEADVSRGDIDDSLTVTLGGSYDFDVAKVYLGVQYFDEVKASAFSGVVNDVVDGLSGYKIKGYGVSLTADAPVAGGKAMFGVGYLDADTSDNWEDNHVGSTAELQRYVVSVGYSYPFSKRTDVYGVATYMQDQVEAKTGNVKTADFEPSAYGLYIGLRHLF